jgi:hypothetical protein
MTRNIDEITNLMINALPRCETSMQIIRATAQCDNDVELIRVLADYLVNQVRQSEALKNKIENLYVKTNVQDSGKTHTTCQPFRTTGVNEMIPATCKI